MGMGSNGQYQVMRLLFMSCLFLPINAAIEYKVFHRRSNFQFAETACTNLNGSHVWQLPVDANQEHLMKFMKVNAITSTWLGIKRQPFTDWEWINGDKFTYKTFKIYEHPGYMCAGVTLQHQILHPLNCGEQSSGFICEISNENFCPEKYHTESCFTEKGHSYLIACNSHDWYDARKYCLDLDGDLAVLNTSGMVEIVLDRVVNRRLTEKCSKIYVGLRKESWASSRNTSQEIKFVDWGTGEPTPGNDCVRLLLSKFGAEIKTAECSSQNAVVCYTEEKRLTNSAADELKGIQGDHGKAIVVWMVTCLVFVGLCVFISMASTCMYIRKQRWQTPFKKQPEIVSTSTSVVVFSSGKIMRDKVYEAKENISILNIFWNKDGKASRKSIERPKIIDVICKAYRKLDMNNSLQIVNIYHRGNSNKKFVDFLPNKYLVGILQFLLDRSGVIEAVLLPRFDKTLTDNKEVLSMLWDLRAKVILVTEATPGPSLPADDILAISGHNVASLKHSGNVDFIVQDNDPDVTANGAAYVVGLAAAIKVANSKQITEARTQFIRHLFLNMISPERSIYNGFGILEISNIKLPDETQIYNARQSICRERIFASDYHLISNVPAEHSFSVPPSTTEDFSEIRIGLLRPCSGPVDGLPGWNITIKNGTMVFKKRIPYQDEELHTITDTLLYLYKKKTDVEKFKNAVKIIWFSVCDEAWHYVEEALDGFMNEIIKCHVVYVTNVMDKPSDKIAKYIFRLSQNCVLLTQALNKKAKSAPCDFPADRVISIGRTARDMEKIHMFESNQATDNLPESNENPDLLPMIPIPKPEARRKYQSRNIQSLGSTLDFLCGLEFEDRDSVVKPANFQGVAVASMILIKALSLGTEIQVMRRICTTPVMHAILRHMSGHPHYHSMEEGWGELNPLSYLGDEKTFKSILQRYTTPENENRYWAGKNV